MPRLGELLVATGLLSIEQVEQALRAQVMWGGRLGTTLIELGYLDLDSLAITLGKQHRLPAALARHFDKADRVLQQKLSPDVAERYSAVPLLRVTEGKVVVAMVDLIDKRGLAIIADELEVTPAQIVPAIAAELRIRYHLERVYRIPRAARFLRVRGKTNPEFPVFEIAQIDLDDSEVNIALPGEEAPTIAPRQSPPRPQLELDPEPALEPDRAPAEETSLELEIEIDDSEPAQVYGGPPPLELADEATPLGGYIDAPDPDGTAEPEQIDDYHGVVTLDSEAPEDAEQREKTTPFLDDATPTPIVDDGSGRDRRRYIRTITDEPGTESERQALARIAIKRVAVASGTGQTLGEATRAIRRATDRDRVAELVLAAIDRFLPTSEGAVLLVVRGGLAIGWKGFARGAASLAEVGIPLDEPGMLPRAIQRCTTVRSPASDLGPIDQLVLVSLGAQTGELIVVPVSIGNQVMCLIAIVASEHPNVSAAESIAAAAGAAFARLMRDAAR